MAKPNYSWDQASDQLTRYLSPIYLPAGANGLTLTYAYRATATPPTVPPARASGSAASIATWAVSCPSPPHRSR